VSRLLPPRRWRRPNQVSLRTALVTALALVLLAATNIAAQASNSAALFLMQPVGARAVGHGESAVADTLLSTEGIWWNPAGMARNRKREVSVHHGQAFGATTDLLSVTVPSRALGTIGVGYFLLAYPDGPAIDENGNPNGVLSSRYHVLTAAYGTPMGKRFSAGLTAKFIMIRFICSGCLDRSGDVVGNAGAVDFGAQYILPTRLPVTIGASVRNIGPSLRGKDAEQADPLPRIVQVGARTRLPIAALSQRETALELMSDVVVSTAYTSPSLRFGADLSYRENYTLRAGYKSLSNDDGLERGLTAGVGFKYNSLQLDIARRFDSTGNISESTAPTFVSLRFVF